MEVSSGVTQQSISVIFLRQKASFPQLVKFSLSYNDEKLQTFFQELSVVSTNDFIPFFCFRRPDTPEARKKFESFKVRVRNRKSNVTLEDRVPKTWAHMNPLKPKIKL